VAFSIILGGIAGLSFLLLLWQWLVAVRFPLHRREASRSAEPPVTLLKPLKGCDETTRASLRSWFTQEYCGAVQILFGVASGEDPVCQIVRDLIAEFPKQDVQLLVCDSLSGTNLKVAKLKEIERAAKHELLVISDADVRVPPDLLSNLAAPLAGAKCGLVNCFYQFANPTTLAMDWEAIAMNADFWAQVLQSRSLKPLDFALGAVMATRRENLRRIGGFAALADCLADDYQLGQRIARDGYHIALSPVTVQCWSAPMGWRAVWKHQLRWARTIRVCQPTPYFFSILNNATLWPLIWLAVSFSTPILLATTGAVFVRMLSAIDLQRRLNRPDTRGLFKLVGLSWLAPLKDLLQFALWLGAFVGNTIEWRGRTMRLRGDGSLVAQE